MSLIVAIKDRDRIIFGSDKQSSFGSNKDHAATKIWEVSELPGAIMGGVGSVRASQVVQYNKLIDLNDLAQYGPTTSFIINSVAPALIDLLTKHGVMCTNAVDKDTPVVMMPNAFLFAYADQAWMIWNDLSVTELGEYLAIGSGSDVANGALFATVSKNPFERIVTAIDAAAETTLYVDDGVDILATKYYAKDDRLITKALGGIDIRAILDIDTKDETSKNKEAEAENKSVEDKKEVVKPTNKKDKKASKKDK